MKKLLLSALSTLLLAITGVAQTPASIGTTPDRLPLPHTWDEMLTLSTNSIGGMLVTMRFDDPPYQEFARAGTLYSVATNTMEEFVPRVLKTMLDNAVPLIASTNVTRPIGLDYSFMSTNGVFVFGGRAQFKLINNNGHYETPPSIPQTWQLYPMFTTKFPVAFPRLLKARLVIKDGDTVVFDKMSGVDQTFIASAPLRSLLLPTRFLTNHVGGQLTVWDLDYKQVTYDWATGARIPARIDLRQGIARSYPGYARIAITGSPNARIKIICFVLGQPGEKITETVLNAEGRTDWIISTDSPGETFKVIYVD